MGGVYIIYKYKISIPYGAIKRRVGQGKGNTNIKFQFLMVRLKEVKKKE